MPIRLRTRLPAGRRIEVGHLLVSGGEVWARFNRSLVVWRAPAGRIPTSAESLAYGSACGCHPVCASRLALRVP